uniref:DNA-directed DNA polymerase n=1 Tax=Globodera rostochiensis TaxID=31243 RepID=A0A914HZT0_GLORO
MRSIIFVVLLLHTVAAMIVEEGVKIEDLPEYKEWRRRQGFPTPTSTSPKTTTTPVTGLQPCKDRPADDNYLGHIFCYALFALYAMMMLSLIIYQLRSILWIKQRRQTQNSSQSPSPSKRESVPSLIYGVPASQFGPPSPPPPLLFGNGQQPNFPNFGSKSPDGTRVPRRKLPRDYVRKLEEDIEHSAKFNVVKVKSKFQIEDLPADPEALLAGVFQKCVDDALEESRQYGHEPDRLGCLISSEHLDTDVWTPIREINDNIVDVILNRFLSVVQSKKSVSLLGAPFTVKVTTVSRKGLPESRTLKGGARRPPRAVQHQISEHALIKIHNKNNHCLFYALIAALMHHISNWAPWKFYNYINGRYGSAEQFEQDTEKLMRCVGAPLFQNGYEAATWVPRVVDYWNNEQYVNEHSIKVFIFGEGGRYKPLFKYGPDNYNMALRLYFNNEHFDAVKRFGRLFGKPYCLSCEVPYDKAATHSKSCKARCIQCGRVGLAYPCMADGGFKELCTGCKKTFNNNNCFQQHLQSNFCSRSKKCLECGVIWDVKLNTARGRTGHKCDERYCYTCWGFHSKARGCFIHPLEPKTAKPYRIVSFDVETMQHVPLNPEAAAEMQKMIHQVNFVAAKIACPECIDTGKWRSSLAASPCAVCGPCRTITFNQHSFSSSTKVDKQIVTADPLEQFIDWILYSLPVEYDTVAFSHYGGRFDMVLTVIFRDSYNLMPCSLSALVPAYGLDVVEKPFFPHLVNRPDNYAVDVWPSKNDYMANGMMPARRSDFDKWYDQNKQHPFRLEEALASYCKNDVEILMCALVAFRTEFMDVSKRQDIHDGIDVLREAMTIAAACMRHFKTNHLQAEHLAIVPEKGYDNTDNQSLLALKYLQWYSEKHGVKVQGAHSPEKEKKIANYQVDGWVESLGLAIEVNGCVWHGCSRCFPLDEQLLPNGKTAGMTRQLDAARLAFIRSQVTEVEVVWECDIRKQLEKDKEMRSKFERYRDEGPLSIRECFTGGRCGPRKMFHAVQPGQKISYYDVTSLYPFINATTKYPVGHPEVHVLNVAVSWTLPEHNPYKMALLKVFIIPPRTIDIPVLPVRVDGRLIFGICHSCAREFPNGGVLREYSCEHDDEERGWVSSCTSIELDAALEEGYRVTKLYRVLEYAESDDTLFQPYIAEFMAQKIHASGFSDEIKGCKDAEQRFVNECFERFGIQIDQRKMAPNKGKRSLAKLALNNLWGRFSMRNELTQTFVTSDPVDLTEHLDDRSKEVTSVDILNDSTVMISFTTKKEWIEEHGCSNIVVSLWTTSAARLYLLKLMQKIVRSGADLLYTDTDSKQYGLKLRRKDNGETEHVLKLRGITLNYDVKVNQNLCYTTFRERVLHYSETGELDPIPVFTRSLKPNIKKGEVTSEKTCKVYKPYVGKGIVGPDHRILDFGYTRPT